MPPTTLRLTSSSAAQIRSIVQSMYPLARRVMLAMSVNGTLASSAITPAQRETLRRAAVELYRYIPPHDVPLTTAQAAINTAYWGNLARPTADRLGWATFADRDLLLRAIDTLAPVAGAAVKPLPYVSAKGLPKPPVIPNIDPKVIDAYRKDREKSWANIRASYVKYVEDGMKPVNDCLAKQKTQPGLKCPDKGQVLRAADKYIAGDVRQFIGNLLLHVPTDKARKFYENAPKDWMVRSEVLIDDPQVPQLIKEALPYVQWVEAQDEIDKAKAANDKAWEEFQVRVVTRLDEAVGAGGSLFKQAMETGLGVVADVGGGLGSGLKGIGEGAGSLLSSIPLLIGGVAVLGLVALLLLRKK